VEVAFSTHTGSLCATLGIGIIDDKLILENGLAVFFGYDLYISIDLEHLF
jgi:hypothetical protein